MEEIPEGRLHIHPRLHQLLLDFTCSVIVENPPDLYSYAANYFENLYEMEQQNFPPPKYIGHKLSSHVRVPIGLKKMLLDFAISVIITHPPDLTSYAADYFNKKYDLERFATVSRLAAGHVSQMDELVHEPDDRGQLSERVRDMPIFKRLAENDFKVLFQKITPMDTGEGEVIVRQGDPVDHFYIVGSGTYEATVTNGLCCKNDAVAFVYNDTGYFGDFELLSKENRMLETIVCKSPLGKIWTLNKNDFDIIVKQPALEQKQRYATVMRKVSEFRSLSEKEMYMVGSCLEEDSYQEGEVISEEGEVPDDNVVLIIENGKVEAFKSDNPDKRKKLSPYSWIGGFTRAPFEYTFQCATDVNVVVLEQKTVACLPSSDGISSMMEKFLKLKL